MLVKVVSLFLIGMAALAMFGRLRWPGGTKRVGKSGSRLSKPRKCKDCGSFIIGNGPCPCRKGK